MATNEQTKHVWRDPALYELAARAIAVVAVLLPAEGAAIRWLAFASAQLPNALPVAVSANLVDLTAIGVSSVLTGTWYLLIAFGLFVAVFPRFDFEVELRPAEERAALDAYRKASDRLRAARGRRILRPGDPELEGAANQDANLAAFTRDVRSAEEELLILQERARFREQVEMWIKTEFSPRRGQRYAAAAVSLGVGVLLTFVLPIDSTFGPQFFALGAVLSVLASRRYPTRRFRFSDALPIVLVIVAIVIVPAGLAYQPVLARVDLATDADLADGHYLILGDRDGATLLSACAGDREVVAIHADQIVSAAFLPREPANLPSYLNIVQGAEWTTGMSLACDVAVPAP